MDRDIKQYILEVLHAENKSLMTDLEECITHVGPLDDMTVKAEALFIQNINAQLEICKLK